MSVVVGCGGSQATEQLHNARDQYSIAANSNANKYSLDSLYEAKKALHEAEQAHQDEPGSYEERSRAYVATRTAQLAMAKADLAEAVVNKREAEQNLVQSRERMLSDKESALRSAAERLEEERRARKQAENRAQLAMQSLKDVAKVKEESRGIVITLDGSVLFLTGESTLLPVAQEQLGRVAQTLKDMGGEPRLRIEGHTDSRGSEENNMELSRARAQSVATYLVGEGIARSRIEVVGMGESQPVATNDTPEGRANNRRVEIVVAGRGGTGSVSSNASPPHGAQSAPMPTERASQQ